MRQPRGSLIWFLFSPRGRISRIEFWVFHLAIVAIAFVSLIAVGFSYDPFVGTGIVSATMFMLLGYVTLAFMALAVLSSLAVSAKRFHDRNRSGWWALVALVPVVGILWIVVECGCLKGTSGGNRFGPDPLRGHSETLSEVFE